MPLDLDNLVAIDVHTHAEAPCGTPQWTDARELQEGMAKYFKKEFLQPSIDEIAQYYRERKIAVVIFTVDHEFNLGHRRYANEEVAELANKNSDIMIPFASIDPHKGKLGAREARRLVEEYGVQGFKFHPSTQAFHPSDRMAYPLYEAIQETGKPALFHTGQTGVGSGMRGGYGIKLEYSNPMYLDAVAADFPDMPIIMAHPSFPWQEEALSVAQHKPNVYIDLSGWSPKYFPEILIRYSNTLLKDKVLFGSDFPAITPDRWLKDFEAAPFRDEVRPLILKQNAIKLLKLRPGA
jgi:predicted TIM-barrel fold metal-dependent hydrolase